MHRHGEACRRDRRDRYKNPQNAFHCDVPMAGRGALEIQTLNLSINIEAPIPVA